MRLCLMQVDLWKTYSPTQTHPTPGKMQQARSLHKGLGTVTIHAAVFHLQTFTARLLCAISELGMQRTRAAADTAHRPKVLQQGCQRLTGTQALAPFLLSHFFSWACPVMRQVSHQRAPEEFKPKLAPVLAGNVFCEFSDLSCISHRI